MLTRNKVENLLFDFGISPNIKGFRYIVDAVMEYENYKPMMNVYVDVAKKNKDYHTNVERSIRHAFSKLDFQDRRIAEFFGDTKKSNGELIATIHLKLSRDPIENKEQLSKTDIDIIKRLKVFLDSMVREIDKILEESEEQKYE